MPLTHKEISLFRIDPRAIEMLPESVARDSLVLPVRWSNGTLHLLLPAEAETDGITLNRLKIVLECPFTYELAVTDDLRPFVDFYYTAVYSEISNCGSTWQSRCPRRWAELHPTDDGRVRFCGVCNLPVTFCTSVEELTRLSPLNKCAVYSDQSEHCDSFVRSVNE